MRRTSRPHSLTAAPPRPGNLPHELNRFVGRSAELAAFDCALSATRLVTVTGSGGVGKSRLVAHALARTAADAAPADGVWRVELAPVRREELVEHAVVEALGLTDHTPRPPRQVLVDHLAERRLLLVVDGFEHLVDACAALLRDLLRAAPGLRVVAVGRRPLALEGERLFPLAPLTAADAVELFADRAAALLPGFDLDDGCRDDVLEVCRRLDCLPLSVELAAGRLRALSPRRLLERLDDRFRLLTGGGRDALPRHQTLRTTIGWSHELCTPAERLLWARLSVFCGPFDLEAAEYVCSGEDLPADTVLDTLDELLAQSVVAREETPAGVRYRMLDTVRAYGAEWLAGIGDQGRMQSRHRDWYLGMATWCELEWFSPRQSAVAARVEAELPNLRAALEFCLTEPGQTHLGQYLAGTLWFYWSGCGRLSEGRHWLDRSIALDRGDADGDEEAGHGEAGGQGEHGGARLKALWVLGYVAILQGDTVPALAALQECHDAAERGGDATALAYAVHRTGCLALVTDDLPRAERLLRDALVRYREIGELNSNVLMGQVELAMTVAFRGDLAQAAALCEDVRQVCEDHGERWTLAYALYVLAYADWAEGRLARARALLERCLAIDHEFHDLLGTVLAVELLALVTVAEGDAAEAAVLQGAAARIWPSVGLPLFGSAHYNAPHALCEAKAREALGDARFEELTRAGERLGHDEAVSRALRNANPPPPRPRAVGRRRAETQVVLHPLSAEGDPGTGGQRA
ncbi:ATP-binding protein [Streptomyces beihaiensis]|uniref:Regulator n=1 Tax=Streptomyces beihaiensis TaxID=2984495 RepID=A0ABT3TZT1_9ACTN|nr:AAA family ATPase [Streptomyces beihaiensis]MCX3062534.1 regulator [Streptomyces beihaiensis]